MCDVYLENQAQHGKHYANSTEHAKRQAIYQSTHADITNHNARYAAGNETYEKGHNFFSDLVRIICLLNLYRCRKERDTDGSGSFFWFFVLCILKTKQADEL